MPKLTKGAISAYFRTECLRQLYLNLATDEEIEKNDLPPRQTKIPGIRIAAEHGREWEMEKAEDLEKTFGRLDPNALIGNKKNYKDKTKFDKIPLEDAISSAKAHCFILEGFYEVYDLFKNRFKMADYGKKYNLKYSKLRPDIIQILPSKAGSEFILPDGNISELSETDTRLRLRIIDIKRTANPTKAYFSEIVYYAIVLVNWLEFNKLDDKFVVVPEGAIWHGSHQASYIVKKGIELDKLGSPLTVDLFEEALEKDIEKVPFEVIFFKLKDLIEKQLPLVLSQDWNYFKVYVNFRCQSCDFVGRQYKDDEGNYVYDERHCTPIAKREDNLSRIMGMSIGASNSLSDNGINKVEQLAPLDSEDKIFDTHQVLKEMRDIFPLRANSLKTNISNIPKNLAALSFLPSWQDLAVYISVDYDVGSDLAVALGVSAIWVDPSEIEEGEKRKIKDWKNVFIVDTRDINVEKRELINFLEFIHQILTEAEELNEGTRVQFYIWQKIRFDYLISLIGRHLDDILLASDISMLAWLFPPKEVMKNEEIEKRTYITVVQDVIHSTVSLPVAHYYTLEKSCEHWNRNPDAFNKNKIHSLYKYELTDDIPPERIDEIWTRKKDWLRTLENLKYTVIKKLNLLKEVTIKTQTELRDQKILNHTSPRIDIRPPIIKQGLCLDSIFWWHFAKLDSVLVENEIKAINSLPPRTREAKWNSARLTERIRDKRKINEIMTSYQIKDYTDCIVYKLNPDSREVKLREGDFDLVLSPEKDAQFLNTKLITKIRGSSFENDFRSDYEKALYLKMERITKVTVLKIDRENLIVVLKFNNKYSALCWDLIHKNIIDLSSNVILDKTYSDHFSGKVETCLKAIGNPKIASNSSLVKKALGINKSLSKVFNTTYPVSEILWDAKALNETTIERDIVGIKTILEGKNINLNESQWYAWEKALTTRLQLIWGPPGTGKSKTAITIVIGAMVNAYIKGKPLRVLISSLTYQAIDNVLLEIVQKIKTMFPQINFEAYRLRSENYVSDKSIKGITDVIPKKSEKIFDELTNTVIISKVIVGGPPVQVYRLINDNSSDKILPLFDLILIDEASQLDMCHAILPLCSLSNDGTAIFTGDLKQLGPIHKAEAPIGLEHMIGSIYAYIKEVQKVPDIMLSVNYRSNKPIVDFSHCAGYLNKLESKNPNLKLAFCENLPEERPYYWPKTLFWTPFWAKLLDAENPLTCFVYQDGKSSQWNIFEAKSIVSLVYVLQRTLSKNLLNDQEEHISELYMPDEFWEKGIGIVTPHRAQQALITRELQSVFCDESYKFRVYPIKIRNAVDTVERFQGQERAVIIASYALGDPDVIRNEEEFLTSLNRFNVMVSRARAKIILFVSKEIINHISNDLKVLEQSKLLKIFAESYCNNREEAELGYIDNTIEKRVKGEIRYRCF